CSESDAIAERLLTRKTKVHDVLHTQAERRAGDRIVKGDLVPVGGEPEPIERTRLRCEEEPDRLRIGLFRLGIDVPPREGPVPPTLLIDGIRDRAERPTGRHRV